LANYFHQKGNQLILADINDYPKGEYPNTDCQLIKADVRNSQAMDKLTKGVDFVIHGAAALPLSKKEEIFSTNIKGTRTVLQASLKNKVKIFVHISSTAVYGVPIKHPILETDPLVGVGPYGKARYRLRQNVVNTERKVWWLRW
jgi:nucleoside-diphosphate-sugar epimerase